MERNEKGMGKRRKLKYQLYGVILFAAFMICLCSMIYYYSFKRIIYNRADQTAEQMLRQASQNVSTMLEDVVRTSRGICNNGYVQDIMVSEDPVESIKLYDYVKQIISVTKAANNNIYSIAWMNMDSRLVADPFVNDNEILAKLDAVYHLKEQDYRKPMYTSCINGITESFRYFGYIFPIYSTNSIYVEKIGYGIFILDTSELEKSVKINNITPNSIFAIINPENEVVVSNREVTLGEEILSDTREHYIDVYEGKESIIQTRKIEENDWKIVSIIPLEDLTRDMKRVMVTGLIVAAAGVAVLYLLGRLFINNITRPINRIVEFLETTETRVLKSRIEIPESNEIAVIATSMNDMLNRIDQMTHKIVDNQALLYEAKLAKQDAELSALQSQINPHFLYNTLNCISNMGIVYDIPQIPEITMAMSNMYRYSIKGDNMVPLREELGCIKEYMKIMDIRFGGKFEISYKIEDRFLEWETLRMILQPVVENSVYHGMERRSGKGKLVIEAGVSDTGQFVLKVQDNGCGMSKEQLEKLRLSIRDYEHMGIYSSDKRSIGLSNINKRIKLQFGAEYGLSVESKEQKGTTVTLILPVITGKEDFANGAEGTATHQ